MSYETQPVPPGEPSVYRMRIRMLVLALVAGSAEGAPTPAPPRAPPGFTVEKAAGEPAVVFPMFAALDDRGRLFVAESSGLDLYAEIRALTRKCRVKLLEDSDGDGRFETSRVFADGLVFPMGLAFREGKLYVADPPDLAVLEDQDGDGRADRRRAILSGFGHLDNGSLHGLVFGPDGLLYMTTGSPDGYRLTREDGSVLAGQSGALFRCRPDGSGVEVLCRGFLNLVEVAFLPAGEVVGTDNWYQEPSGGLRDALVHLVEGGLYPYHPDVGPDGRPDTATPQPVTGDPLPAISLFPAVALSGLLVYRGRAFPPEFRGDLFSAQHNSRKVGRHRLERDGETFRSRDSDFLTSDDIDFHPSDVLEDARGDLLVVDTGGWYVHHCPTGRIRDSRAAGGIYRVRYAGPPHAEDDVERRALARDRKAAEVWALAATPGSGSLKSLQSELSGPDPEIAALAARALARRGDRDAGPILSRLLEVGSPPVRMAAAEALARCGGREALPAIWRALEREPGGSSRSSRFLEHALIHAAHRIAAAADLEAALLHPSPRVEAAALLLLDQPPRGGLLPEQVLARTSSPHAELRRTALRVLGNHPRWGDRAADLIRERIERSSQSPEELQSLAELVVAFHREPPVAENLGKAVANRDGKLPPERLVFLLETLAQAGPSEVPRAWIEGMAEAARHADPRVRLEAVRAAAVLGVAALEGELVKLAGAAGESSELRLEAIRALAPRQPSLEEPLFEFLLREIGKEADPLLRLRAVEIATRAALSEAQRARLREAIGNDPLLSPASPPETSEDDRARLLEHLPLLEGGSPERGRRVFFEAKTACSSCHRVGSAGGAIAPDLTRVAAIRSGRDILESILFPSSTFAQGYESHRVRLKDGRLLGGILARQTTGSVLLRDASGAELLLRRERILDIERQPTSLMPEGLERALSREELRDLLAFLLSLR